MSTSTDPTPINATHHCPDGDRHCAFPNEYNYFNIFNRTNNIDNDVVGDNNTVDNACTAKSNDDGSYGIVPADENSNEPPPLETTITFSYQIQTSLAISNFQTSDSSAPLAMIEKAISDVLVRHYVGCGEGDATSDERFRTGNTRRQLRLGRRMIVGMNDTVNDDWTGWTMDPVDQILPGLAGVTCHTPLREPATRCYTVGGAWTAFSSRSSANNNNQTSEMASTMKRVIQHAMNQQQQLNRVHDQIYDVYYVSDDVVDDSGSMGVPQSPTQVVIPLAPTTAASPSSTPSERRVRDFAIWPWIFVPLTIVLVAIAVYELYRIRQRRRRFHSSSSRSHSCMDDPSTPPDMNLRAERQHGTHTGTEYGPFLGSFPNATTHRPRGSSERDLDSGVVHDHLREPSRGLDTTTAHGPEDDDNLHHFIDADGPTFSWDTLDDHNHNNDDLMMVNTSYDTELYYNSIASSSGGHGSSNDTKGRSGGQFPSTVSFIT